MFGRGAGNPGLISSSLALKATRTGQRLAGLLERLKRRPASETEWSGMHMFVRNQVR